MSPTDHDAGLGANPPAVPVEGHAQRKALKQAVRRRPEAIHAVVTEHGPRLRRYLLGMLGAAAPVDDLVQEAMIIALSTIDNLRDDVSPSTWLHGIARNLARNWRRKEGNRFRLMQQTPQAESYVRGTEPADPEQQHRRHQSLSRMQALLAQLPETEHEAFVLHHLSGHSLTDVASVQGVAVSTVSARVKRAEQVLRRAMEDNL